MKSRYISRFEENIKVAEKLESIYSYLNQEAKCLDASSLLRSEFVFIVGTLDTYMHMVVEDKIVNMFFDKSGFVSEFTVSVSEVKKLFATIDENDKIEIFRNIVKQKLAKDSFQAPKSIEYAFSLIGLRKVWSTVNSGMGMSSEDVKNKLSLIVNRRNMIAHESDRNRATGELEVIDLGMVRESKDFIVKLVNLFENTLVKRVL